MGGQVHWLSCRMAGIGLIYYLTGQALSFQDMKRLYEVVQDATDNPIDQQWYYQNDELLQQIYARPSAQHYFSSSLGKMSSTVLEWQKREGYCAGSTLRCILKSLPGFPTQNLPRIAAGLNDPEDFCQAAEANSWEEEREHSIPTQNVTTATITTQLFRLDDGPKDNDKIVSYKTFLATLEQKLEDPNTRVGVNYLRPALFGFSTPQWYLWPFVPVSFFFGLFAGHFSVILGTIQPEKKGAVPLIAVFDVNHVYGGTYLVPAPRLYQAIYAKDIGTHRSRALIFVSKKTTSTRPHSNINATTTS